jgi:CheY-like chemotaxis protein
VVEDESAVRELTVEYLKNLGYQVLEAENGLSALNLFKTHPKSIDLLLSDVVMPGGLSGPELAKEAKARYPKLKILFASGYPKNALIDHPSLAQPVHLMAKPYKLHELAFKIRQILDG